MMCPVCQTANPEAARFCLSCGAALASTCAGCQAELPSGARFCVRCGQPVAAAPTPTEQDRLERLAAAAPGTLATKMRAAPLTSERRVATALFVDVVGSTTLAEHMDPEDWAAVMNGAFDRLTPAVYRYEGTVARLMGDALLAFFGAPVAHEDDPARAVHAALDMLAAAREYAAEVQGRHGFEFAVRIGLNTGSVVVGAVGSNLMYEYTAMGDAVNLAARMQAAARPMTALITEHTHRFVAPLFDCVDVGVVEVRGRDVPVRAYEVRSALAQPGRVRGLAGLESAMVGRDDELAALLRLAQTAGAGLGRAAAVIGDPGLGKSRLVAELKAALERQAPFLVWYEAHCLSHGQGLPYHLASSLVRSLAGASLSADESETATALHALCDDLFGVAAMDVYPFLGHLMTLPLEGAALERVRVLDPQTLQGRYLATLRRLLAALASRHPLALVLDDVHWADSSSVELLSKLVSLVGEAPLFLCVVTRPERESPGWKLLAAAREALGAGLVELTVTPLSESHSRELVGNLLEVEAIPEGVRDLILRRADGNPFFVEEVIRMLIDRGAIVRLNGRWSAGSAIQTVEIPDNVHGLLLARIDRLPDEARRTLRIASVIGRQFPVRVLEDVLTRHS